MTASRYVRERARVGCSAAECAGLFDEIEPTVQAVSAMARNVVVHYRASGRQLPEHSREDISLRWVDAILAPDQTRHQTPLTVHRRPLTNTGRPIDHLDGLLDRIDATELTAVAEERARIARDLHDSAGHAINVIAVRAGAARLGHDRDTDRSLRALEAIEELARQTVAEIDEIVGTLREEGAATGPVDAPPGLASVDTLVAHHTAAGLDLRVRTTGNVRRLASIVDQAAYRILQEALTNAARYGAGTARSTSSP